jgi:hypothetical protein
MLKLHNAINWLILRAFHIKPLTPSLSRGGPKRGSLKSSEPLDFTGRPERVRTSDQLIKSQLLCQLSYRPINQKQHTWRARQDSNLRPTGSKPGALSS